MNLISQPIWHAGELAWQKQLGFAEQMAAVGARAIRDAMPDQHRTFFAQLPFILAGYENAAGQVWASLLSGPPGFVFSPDPRRLRIDIVPAAADPIAAALQPGHALGLLGIELPTRRRNRANGRVELVDETGFVLAVEQSYGNCPKYIEKRELRRVPCRLHAGHIRIDPRFGRVACTPTDPKCRNIFRSLNRRAAARCRMYRIAAVKPRFRCHRRGLAR